MIVQVIIMLSIFYSSSIKGQESYLRSFVQDVADSRLSNNNVIDKYTCIVTTVNKDKKQDEVLKYISVAMDSLRINILQGSTKLITIKKYLDLPPSEQKILCDTSSMKDIFVVYHQDKILISVLFNGNKIASFITLNKGESGNKIFMKFCSVEE